jgi:hypothetical protein
MPTPARILVSTEEAFKADHGGTATTPGAEINTTTKI